jgi:hypothetical protein
MRLLAGLVSLACVAATAAAPAPKAKDAGEYFPIRQGDKRVYDQREGGRVTNTFTDVVTAVDQRHDGRRVTVRRTFPETAPFVTTVAVSRDGVFRVAVGERTLDKPMTLLKLPATAATKWEQDGRTFTVVKDEEVEVPAGKYLAVRVDVAGPDGKPVTRLWFAPEVGLVKMTDPSGETVLKSFTPGK